jgi:hypothetical protein
MSLELEPGGIAEDEPLLSVVAPPGLELPEP